MRGRRQNGNGDPLGRYVRAMQAEARATSALEGKGLFVRLCDDCYRGKEELAPAAETKTEDAA